ncbi:hypothetical protein NB311A_03489 [Nitrobacter sp. Nb-311A]|nr:hypothetical protein NB311A_03489 [Nitrobacter sp. Nb-311A]
MRAFRGDHVRDVWIDRLIDHPDLAS